MTTEPHAASPPLPADLRRDLLARRQAFAHSPGWEPAQAALMAHLVPVLQQLEPQCLGLYWPIQGEFNAPLLCAAAEGWPGLPWALPFAQREPMQMHYRAWTGQLPLLRDDCGIPAADGPLAAPDVVLVPCVGFTRAGYRLGYGAGYFDRWLAAHPHVTAIGVAWSFGELTDAEWAPQPHDQPLMGVVTEHGVVSGG